MMNEAVYIFPEKATIDNIEEIFEALKNLINKSDQICLDFSNIKNYDISFLQLICSFHNLLINQKKSLKVIATIKDNTFLKKVGFLTTIKNCKQIKNGFCLLE